VIANHKTTGAITNEHALEQETEIQDGTVGVAPEEITATTSIDEEAA
jgi:hypothetical protein